MEEQNQPAVPVPTQSDVGFPQPQEQTKGKFPKWILAIVGVLVILIVGGWFLFKGASVEPSATPSPVPNTLSTFGTPKPTENSEPTPSPKPVEKEELSVEVLNGTGTPGDASFLQSEFKKLGFDEVSAGNADEQEETRTTVTFDKDLPDSIIDEVTDKLEDLYESVRVKKGSLGGVDIRVLTGPRISSGTTAKSTPTPSPDPEASPSAIPSS